MYIGVSAGKFDEMIKDGRMPGPRRIDARRVWDVRDLDSAFDQLPYENALPGTGWEDAHKDGELPASERASPASDWTKTAMALAASGPTVLAEGYLWSLDEWRAHVCASPLNRRETAVLRLLGPCGDQVTPCGEIKGGGMITMDRLVARGFVTAIERRPGRAPDYQLTDTGREAWMKLPAASIASA